MRTNAIKMNASYSHWHVILFIAISIRTTFKTIYMEFKSLSPAHLTALQRMKEETKHPEEIEI